MLSKTGGTKKEVSIKNQREQNKLQQNVPFHNIHIFNESEGRALKYQHCNLHENGNQI